MKKEDLYQVLENKNIAITALSSTPARIDMSKSQLKIELSILFSEQDTIQDFSNLTMKVYKLMSRVKS